MLVIPALERQNQEDHKFKASLGYIVRGKKPPTTEQQKDKLTILKRFK
jgi:hypothetical protein